MKKFTLTIVGYITFIMLCILLSSCISSELHSLTGMSQDLAHYIILGLLALYEIIVRIVPTVANYSIIAFIIKILKWLSDATNREKSAP